MGRVYKPKYAYKKVDGTRVEKITTAWYIEFTGAHGKTVRRKAGITKEQAHDALRKAESDVLSIKNGLPTQRPGNLLLKDVIKRYMNAQRSKVSVSHHKYLEHRLMEIQRNTGAIFVKDLSPDAMDSFLLDLEDKDLSARTINVYLQAAKGMLRWLVLRRQIPYNQLEPVRRRSERVKRHARRALTNEEIDRLLKVALKGPRRRRERSWSGKRESASEIPAKLLPKLKEKGRNNALAYRLMIEAGLRRNEAANLRWSDVDLKEGFLHYRSEWTKNGEEVSLPLSQGLWKALKVWRLQRPPEPGKETVVAISSRLLRQFDEDLNAAGIAKKDASERYVDLHALRHTFGTRLGLTPGIDPKTVQTLMRHSDPRLTFSIYVHTDMRRCRDALAQLPKIGPDRKTKTTSPSPSDKKAG